MEEYPVEGIGRVVPVINFFGAGKPVIRYIHIYIDLVLDPLLPPVGLGLHSLPNQQQPYGRE
jgi:hypothetical protein